MINQLDSVKDMQEKRRWMEAYMPGKPVNGLPFSFKYGGISSSDFLADLPAKTIISKIDENRMEQTVVWEDAASGLQIRCVSVEYTHFPVIEWTLYFKNSGLKNTAILKNIQCLDTFFQLGMDEDFLLHGNKGDTCTAESYEPYKLTFADGEEKKFAPRNGKSTGGNEGWPYYNLQSSDGGVIMALGWPGQWASSFQWDKKEGMNVKAGQELTNLYLKSGEEIRTPLTVLLFWKGTDIVSAQNLWRRWFWLYNMPITENAHPAPLTHIQLARSFTDGEEVMWEQAKAYQEAGIQPDVFWRDANWYPSDQGPFEGGDSWINTGTWEIDRRRFPNGFKAFSDWVHEQGKKFLLWFEPERIGDTNSTLAVNHPEWMLDGTEACGPILHLGDPEALSWLIDHVDNLIKTEGIDWYREDMNGPGPLPAWRKNDPFNRQGITENLYVQGHLAFWDALRNRNPGLRIDSCASGGRRNDLESMRRAVPLLRSDYQFPDELFPQHKQRIVFEANQSHTYGISSWFPYYGSAVVSADSYHARSFYMPAFCVMLPKDWEQNPETRAAVKRAYEECVTLAPMMLGDFYPLTPYSLQLDQWIGWQFNRPENGDGFLQVFRRMDNKEASRKMQLKGLDPFAIYLVMDMGDSVSLSISGRELMEEGYFLEILKKPEARIVTYKRL
ncbi:hypothetical protein EHS13_04880 [Paenibacillus psychroresistens]|uniref:Alpha-galactosidase n=1 Tax=Paenibacillus psychroresistens TaxID=1778678 RepID=A0A6B8RFZ6_9BACL|nr:alpha-galactosidase [Paenibacillus psychroresistens]QGQ94286.1 hypothetical protein EHS13_04880 [Paenibacillus psychroresistens]